MTPSTSPQAILRQLAQIRRMERGKLCQMRPGPNGPYYSHQTWAQGRNVARYVPRDRVPALRTAIAGYQAFLQLTQAYADLIIARTRQEPPPRAKSSSNQRPHHRQPKAKLPPKITKKQKS